MNTKLAVWRAILACLCNMNAAAAAEASPDPQAERNPQVHHPTTGTNWGETSCGLQLSVDFQKQTFTNGEPIICTATLRNVTNIYVDFFGNVPSYKEVLVAKERGGRVEEATLLKPGTPFEKRAARMVINPILTPIPPGAQSTFCMRLDTVYNMSEPGFYVIHLRLKLPREPLGTSNPEVVSGSTRIRVVSGTAKPVEKGSGRKGNAQDIPKSGAAKTPATPTAPK